MHPYVSLPVVDFVRPSHLCFHSIFIFFRLEEVVFTGFKILFSKIMKNLVILYLQVLISAHFFEAGLCGPRPNLPQL